jgi:RND superfamily putative drug exporter
MPKRFVEHPEIDSGFWGRWGRAVVKRPALYAGIGILIVALLLIPAAQLNPAEAQAKDLRGTKTDDGVVGYDRLVAAGISPGVLKPFVILVDNVAAPALPTAVREIGATCGVIGAAAPPAWRKGNAALMEAFPDVDGSAKSVRGTISRLKNDVLPVLPDLPGVSSSSPDARFSLGGTAPEERDFVHAVYGKFPYVLGFVILLTLVLLMRAFRSVVLPIKAVILNLISLGAAFGIIVLIFQMGHGAEAIWHVHPTNAIISWIPLMIFAFLYGLSMDYEVFMLTRMREAYDETGDTNTAISLGLARTGKLVTSAALVLMFAFFVLSTSPGTDVKQFGIGLAAGIIFDATVIRALLVPSIMSLIGRWNWWLPAPAARVLLTKPSKPAPESA